MSAPTMDDTDVRATASWLPVAVPIGLGLLLLGLLFQTEIVAAVHNWNASTAYNHCYLILPIVAYLLWDRRVDLEGQRARPMPAALFLAVPVAVVWLAAERLGIMEGRQLMAVTFAQVLFLAVLGPRLWWAVAGPLLYLYFLVPFGEFLTPRLQDFTTWFIREGLAIIGIPAYIDGYVIEIPQGTFFVAEACAGLRFLIASIAFGCLYSLTMYRGAVRRGVFILASIIVPIIANGFRGLGIVSLGWMLGSAQAAATDHVLYGWIFFSIVIVILILLGLPFRQDDQPSVAPVVPDGAPFPMRAALGIVAGVVALAAVGPSVARTLDQANSVPVPVPVAIDFGPGCESQVDPTPRPIRTERVHCGDYTMDVAWTALPPRVTAGPLMAVRRRMVERVETESLSENWLDQKDGKPSAWRIMVSNDPVYVTSVAVWVNGKPTRPGLAMRLRMAMSSVFGGHYAPMVVTVTPAGDQDAEPGFQRQLAAAVSGFLSSHPGVNTTVGQLSALH